jgi:DNA-binding FrmR family transcriptional regulator
MIEGGRPCLELAQQLHAVEKAIQQAKRVLVQYHIEHCLDDSIGPLEPDQKRRVDEFKAIARYL